MHDVIQQFEVEFVEICWLVVSFGAQIGDNSVCNSLEDVFLSEADLVHWATEVGKLEFVEVVEIFTESTNEAIIDVVALVIWVSINSEQIAELLRRGWSLLDLLHMLGVENLKYVSGDRMLANLRFASVLSSVF